MIEVKHSAGDEWVVTVKSSDTTRHRVRVSKADLERLAAGRTADELLAESFRFLLEREPNTSILSFAFSEMYVSRRIRLHINHILGPI